MKHSFSRKVDFTPEWERNRELPLSEQIKCTLVPLKIGDVTEMMDIIANMKRGADGSVTDQKDIKGFIDSVAPHMVANVTLSGLEDNSGPVSVEDLTTWGPYLSLATEIAMELVRISMPTADVEGNSKGQPASS